MSDLNIFFLVLKKPNTKKRMPTLSYTNFLEGKIRTRESFYPHTTPNGSLEIKVTSVVVNAVGLKFRIICLPVSSGMESGSAVQFLKSLGYLVEELGRGVHPAESLIPFTSSPYKNETCANLLESLHLGTSTLMKMVTLFDGKETVHATNKS